MIPPLSWILLQTLGGALGYLVSAWFGACAGLALVSLLWFAQDSWRALTLLRWVRTGNRALPPSLRGWYKDVAAHVLRQFRLREKRYEAAEARLRDFLSALQASPNGVVLLDAQARIEWCNQTAATQLGVDVQRDLMQQIGNLVRDPAFNAYMATGDFTHEVRIAGRESSLTRPVQLAVHLHPYGEGRKLLLARDITALEQAQAMQREFVANVSHEIRTPLTVLAGFVETLETLPLDAHEQARYLRLMAQQAQRMQILVEDLLALSRLEGSPMPGDSEQTPVATLMAECERDARALSSVLSRTGHALHFHPPPEAVGLLGVHPELLSALSNLVSNAVRYTPAGGRVSVTWEALPGGEGVLQVRDTGPGIAPEHLPRLTERFYRVDRSRSRDTGGTGLGLAIVKQVMQRHGGRLQMDSTLGSGSCFGLVFPANRIRHASAT